jgi:hypothetical protein
MVRISTMREDGASLNHLARKTRAGSRGLQIKKLNKGVEFTSVDRVVETGSLRLCTIGSAASIRPIPAAHTTSSKRMPKRKGAVETLLP